MRNLALTASLLATFAFACDKEAPAKPAADAGDKPAAEPDEPEAEAEPEPVKPTLGAPTGMLGCKTTGTATPAGALPFALETCPTIPSVYGSIVWGMDKETASKAIQKVKMDETSGRFKVGDKWMRFGLSDAGTVDGLRFKISPDGLAAMKAAWGEPLELTGLLDDKSMVWFNPETKIKVEVEPNTFADEGDDSEKFSVRYILYTPIADVVSADGLISKPILGASGEELQKNFPEWLKVKSAEQAAADVAAMGLDDKTAGIAKWAGADEASASLKLPQSETSNNLTVRLEWADSKVSSYYMTFGFGKDEALRTEIAAVVAAGLGAPIAGEQDDDGVWTSYTFAGPEGAEVELRSLSESWSLDVSKPEKAE